MPIKMEIQLRGLEAIVIWMITLFIFVPEFIVGLKDVSVTIPQAVRRGGNALFICNYDMENDTLYSVKWYKGRREFYRYTPKENPAMKTFPSAGINVERNLSNQSHVVLLAVPLSISGKFTCEISVEAPSFLTAMMSGEMEVVELPEQRPIVTGIHSRYRLGDLVDGNCSIKFSKPAANLTWTINGVVVPPHHIKMHQIEKYPEDNLESVFSEIGFMVTTQHFIKGQMKLKCTASLFNIYHEEVEKLIEEDRPRIMASGRSFDMNAYPYDQQSSGDFEDHNESYLTYHSAAADASSSATTISSSNSRKGLRAAAGHLVSLLHRLVVSTSSTPSASSLSSITNVSRRMVKGQIETAAETPPAARRIFCFIVMSISMSMSSLSSSSSSLTARGTTTTTTTAVMAVTSTVTVEAKAGAAKTMTANTGTPLPSASEQRTDYDNDAPRVYASTIMLFTVTVIAVAGALAVFVILTFFMRWRFNDFLSTAKGYYHSPRRQRRHSDNEIDTNRVLSPSTGLLQQRLGLRLRQPEPEREREEHQHGHQNQNHHQQTTMTMTTTTIESVGHHHHHCHHRSQHPMVPSSLMSAQKQPSRIKRPEESFHSC
ncbi:uncharacterized protein LOC129941159 isoform X2 [Eupeodes corollae]|uniref:uncharacterized protein LOC129941159 isoform X2 n=1 Tax=Eupeodes corollae TaxID=290404 RepID=UPI002491C92F|nr:uncharacterized protein LOC129941159 isoform X2 [Eupeodes corollae]